MEGLKIHDFISMQVRNFWLSKEVILGVFFALFIAVPMIVFGGAKQVYVDKDAKGSEDGSANHPYKSIDKALRHAKKGTEVRIAKGTYKENITVPKDVKLFGRKKDIGDVVIRGEKDEPTVTMKDDTELNFLTIEGGRHGIRITENAKANLYQVHIKKSGRDGIHIDSAPRDKKHRALINDVEIEGSQKAGIFSEKRDVMIINSNIHHNQGDGIDLAAGMESWIEDNKVNDNKGSGMKVVLDGAAVWSKNNTFRNNQREGVEVNSYGASGNVGLKKADIVGNGRYGIAKVARTLSGYKTLGGLVLGTGTNDNRIESNRIGGISANLRGF